MSREIPEAIRAVAGLAATVFDEARRLPATLPGLPVRVIGLAMQATMKLQQHYSGLVARGDELFTGLRGDREPGMATFDEDLPPAAGGNGLRSSAFDRAAEAVPDEDVPAAVSDESIAEEVASLIDDEVSGLPPEPAPEEVVEALQDITDQVAAADLPDAPVPGLSTEDALETALLEADGAPDTALAGDGTAEGGLVDPELIAESPSTPPEPVAGDPASGSDAPAPSDPGGSPVGEEAGAPDVGTAGDQGAAAPAPTADASPEPAGDLTADVATEVDVLTADGEVATVEGTVTDEGVAAPETAEDAAPPTADAAAAEVDVLTGDGEVATVEGTVTDEGVAAPETAEDAGTAEGAQPPSADAGQLVATDEGGSPVAAATGRDASQDGEAGTTDGDAGAGESSGGDADAGAAPVDGYDGFTVAQLRGRLRGYQYPTVRDLLAYEEATRARAPFLTMLRNRLEKLDQQAADASPLAPRGV